MPTVNPDRKYHRCYGFDYSQYGIYFITICCNEGKNRLGKLKPVFQNNLISDTVFEPTAIGKYVEEKWLNTSNVYSGITAEDYVIMPNHIHGILVANNENDVSISKVIQAFKSVTTREYKKLYGRTDSLWQPNFYDCIMIEADKEYINRLEYIKNNRINWFLSDI